MSTPIPATTASAIVQRIWNYCNVLRDDGVSYGAYLEQLTYLLFLKMDAENVTLGETSLIPAAFRWETLLALQGAELESHYKATLEALGKGTGLLATIFRKAQNRIQDPVKLRRLLLLINDEIWSGLTVNVKSEIYEGLLERNAQDIKSGAGQYFTPRPLIDAIVDVMQPRPGQRICDPACGTGGFLLAAHSHITEAATLGAIPALDQDQWDHLNHAALHGWEIVDEAARLCVMNLYLHGIGHERESIPIRVGDSLAKHPGETYDLVLTNPPFGRKSSAATVTDDGEVKRETQVIVRDDFWTSTSNKQLSFVQHIRSILRTDGGRAAVVLPDNVLFEGGAGETIRRSLMQECDLHTILRLPTGVFYAQGVKANVLFFERRPGRAEPWTETIWYYDLRTNLHFTLKQNPLTRAALDEFVACYRPGRPRHERVATWSPAQPAGRWRSFSRTELLARDKANLDLFWLKDEALDDAANLPAPEIIAQEIVDDLEAALEQFRAVLVDVDGGG